MMNGHEQTEKSSQEPTSLRYFLEQQREQRRTAAAAQEKKQQQQQANHAAKNPWRGLNRLGNLAPQNIPGGAARENKENGNVADALKKDPGRWETLRSGKVAAKEAVSEYWGRLHPQKAVEAALGLPSQVNDPGANCRRGYLERLEMELSWREQEAREGVKQIETVRSRVRDMTTVDPPTLAGAQQQSVQPVHSKFRPPSSVSTVEEEVVASGPASIGARSAQSAPAAGESALE